MIRQLKIKLCILFPVIFLCVLLLQLSAFAEGKSTTIRLTFAGDCTLGGSEDWMRLRSGTFMTTMEKESDEYPFLLAQDIFSKDDYTMVNLEGVLSDSKRGQKSGLKWNFRGNTKYVGILTAGSIEAVSLGNNHSRDYGEYGLNQTKLTLDGAGIDYCIDRDICYFEKDGIRIAFMSFWRGDFPKHKQWLQETIEELKGSGKCQAVVVIYHGGTEYQQKHSKAQEDAMRFAINSGADLCIGHHPHVVQGVEVYKGRNILYSLGNFCFGGNRKPRSAESLTYVAGIELGFVDGEYSHQQLTIHPYKMSGTPGNNNYQPCPATGKEAVELISRIQYDTSFTLQPYVEGIGAIQEHILAHSKEQ